MSNLTLFNSYLQSWNAQPDGEPFATHAGHLLPVRLDGHPDGRAGMIKIARHIDERVGAQVMRWWDAMALRACMPSMRARAYC
ncbi:aminoglycoside phosphotransferase family protein [Variovorax gossypii]